uniref:exodeoxyribonuclease III n=1 Tax=Aquarana catesbeiana TaxID=8400 RepID=C1C4N3_AQUCT|nr:LINE-1 reverse transcriptase homolog [Aquarana catesbeiana]
MALKVYSCNVKGLNSIGKRWQALKEFKSSKAEVIMVQETHFKPSGSFKFASRHFPIAYTASDPSGKVGVAILIKRTSPIKILSSYLDPHGRFIFLKCSHLSTSFSLINIYAPNVGQIGFLEKVFEKLQPFSQSFMIMGGDFNVCMSPTRDRKTLFQTTSQSSSKKLSTSFRKLVRSHNLFDSWRIKHPTQKHYTFYSHPHKSYSRLDYFLITGPLLPYVVSSEIIHFILIPTSLILD